MLEQYDIAMGYGSAEYLHRFVEAKKLAFEDRARFYADMDFYDAPLEKLISKEYAADSRQALIDREQSAASNLTCRRATRGFEHGDTIYLAVADKDGNMVFAHPEQLLRPRFRPGARRRTGFCLQNRGAAVRLDDGHRQSPTNAEQAPIPHDHPGDSPPRMAPGVHEPSA